jgi:N-methylhydantoinase A
MAYRLGVDVGGTFTDLLLVRDETGDMYRVKTPSTPADPSEGVLVGIRRICEESGVSPGDLAYVMHGTTVATNAMLEAKGARVGLITTQGFGQILHLARSQTPGPLAGWIIMIKPDPPAALEDTREAKERTSAQGEVVEPVDREQVKAIVRDLVDSGVETLTVSLINSYTNPAHEREIRENIHELYPGFPVTISSDVLPEFREYERTLTACMNSYVRPTVESYMKRLDSSLREFGVAGELNLLRSDAGLMSAAVASENPIYGILSGPSGGVAGALYIARRAGYENVLTFDMGGTSTDVALCQNGQPTIERQTEIPYGLGLPGEVIPVKVPSVNVRSVGAGGGSMAHVPEVTGALRVGPQSAGADPGPASYGKGGVDPTVTDANVVVGHLPPQLLGGEMQLDVEAAKAAVQKIGDALGLDLHRAAEGILDIVNENMAGALRLVSVQRGYDPRDFALVAFGGAGPMHANAVARIMGSFPVIVPPAPGLLCATGDLVADFRDEFARTFIRTIDSTSGDEVRGILDELGREAQAWLTREGIDGADQRLAFNVDMRYYRQGYEIPVEIDPALLAGDGTVMLAERFNRLHEQFYGFKMEGTTCEIVNLRAIGYGTMPEPQLAAGEPGDGADPSGAVVDEHEVYFQGEWLPTKIYDRALLQPGHRIDGPAIVTEFDSTTVVLSGFAAEVDRFLNLIVNPVEGDPREREWRRQ